MKANIWWEALNNSPKDKHQQLIKSARAWNTGAVGECMRLGIRASSEAFNEIVNSNVGIELVDLHHRFVEQIINRQFESAKRTLRIIEGLT